jgi:rRNA maturation endonuclease Nob1
MQKERRGPQPSPRLQTCTTLPTDVEDDDDTQSIITNLTTATITPSESASAIFHHNNAFTPLKSSSSDSSTPSTAISRKLAAFENESIVDSQISTSTAKAIIDKKTTPSIATTDSLISLRSSATKDWSTISDSDDEGRKTPTQSMENSFDNLALSDSDDGEGQWITPTNIKKHKIRDATTTNSSLVPVAPRPSRRPSTSSTSSSTAAVMKSACMTGDYAMQNVALQLGLNLVNMEGNGVRSVKTWVLRCHGCFTYHFLSSMLI